MKVNRNRYITLRSCIHCKLFSKALNFKVWLGWRELRVVDCWIRLWERKKKRKPDRSFDFSKNSRPFGNDVFVLMWMKLEFVRANFIITFLWCIFLWFAATTLFTALSPKLFSILWSVLCAPMNICRKIDFIRCDFSFLPPHLMFYVICHAHINNLQMDDAYETSAIFANPNKMEPEYLQLMRARGKWIEKKYDIYSI